MKSERLQLGLLALLLSATGFTLIKVWTNTLPSSQSTTLPLPKQIDLDGWQLKSSKALPLPDKERLERITSILQQGRLYRYQQRGIPLTVELWTIENTNGNVSAYIDAYAQQPIAPGRQQADLRYRSGIGFYGIINTEDRRYLSSCINATGESTFNISQFTQARFQRDLTLTQTINWILGQKSLFKKQCLWSHFSLPNAGRTDKEISILEETWFDWNRWWRLNDSLHKGI
jgi:cyanosortase A-associated protein